MIILGISAAKNEKIKKNKKKQVNLLDMIPEHTCDWSYQHKNTELVRILKPRFDTQLGKRIGEKLKVKETYNINLDEYGTAVWRTIDGKLTVGELGELLQTQFGDKVEPLYPRLAEFLRILESQNVIVIKSKKLKRMHKKR